MSWKLVLFDFDGVLCDSKGLAIEFVEQLRMDPMFASLPSVRTVDHFGELYRGPLRTALSRFGISPEDSQRFFSAHASAMMGRAQELKLFDGVGDGLQSMPPASYAIITSAYSDTVRRVLSNSGVDCAGINIVGHEVRQTKTEKATRYLEGCGLTPEDAIYVGDMESDIEYCRALNLRCVAATYGYHPAELLVESFPYASVHSAVELFAFIQKGLVRS